MQVTWWDDVVTIKVRGDSWLDFLFLCTPS